MYSTEGVVLKRVDIGEADVMFTIYTKDFGKMRARAQGIKKDGAKLRGHLETLSRVNLSFVIGKNGERLIGATLLNFWPGIRKDFSKSAAALYALELIDKNCLNGEKDETLWNLIIGVFCGLEEKRFDFERTGEFLNNFERCFSETQGYSGGGNLATWAVSVTRPFGL